MNTYTRLARSPLIMKITRNQLRRLIKEELAESEETALNSPREAGRQWAYRNLADAVDSALGSGLSNDDIRNVIEEIIGSAEAPELTTYLVRIVTSMAKDDPEADIATIQEQLSAILDDALENAVNQFLG